MRRLIGFARAPGAVALAVVLLLGVGAMRTAGAIQQDGRIIALAYDPGTDTLLNVSAARSPDMIRAFAKATKVKDGLNSAAA